MVENGLHVFDVRVLGERECAPFERVRVGLFVLRVTRAARSETLLSWGPEVQATARVDVVRGSAVAIFLRPALAVGYQIYDWLAFCGASLGIGFEVDIAATLTSLTSRAPTARARTLRICQVP